MEVLLDDAKVIDEFPEYMITREGLVYTRASGIRRKTSLTQEGAVKITLFRSGKAYTKSLPLLVAKAWLYNDYNPDLFDTPIHLDNDSTNNHVDNLAWRPRWFAVKYQRQYWNEEYRYAKTMVQDVKTGEIYETLIEVCQKYGYLYMDVLQSCIKGDVVFPSWREFRFFD